MTQAKKPARRGQVIDFGRLGGLLCATLALGAVLHATPAAALTADEVRERVSTEFGVRVLKVQPSRLDGREVFLVTVMNPGGDFNEAFQITIIAIDAATGKTVPAFRHLASGRRANQAPSHTPNRQSADTFRRGRAWR